MSAETPKAKGKPGPKPGSSTPRPQVEKGSGDNKLTEREIEILGKAWGCMKGQPEIDMHQLAEKLGMTNVGSATNAWGRIKKKLFADIPASSGSGSPANSARKRKGTKNEPTGDGDGNGNGDSGDEPDTPTKKPRKTPAKNPAKTPTKGPGRGKRAPKSDATVGKDDDEEEQQGNGARGDGKKVKKEDGDENGAKPEDSHLAGVA